ncbi:MAG: serine/threonine protein kinase [Planctomycetota bacterium]|nr:serine/threonine protein kinase [Planctomycetota bacterium]
MWPACASGSAPRNWRVEAYARATTERTRRRPDARRAASWPGEPRNCSRSSADKRIAAALDTWAIVEPGGPERDHLVSFAHSINPEGNRIRDAMLKNDPAGLVALADEDASRQSPASGVVNLAMALDSTGARNAATALLSQAQRRFRGDFWINHDLGKFLQGSTPPREADAVRFLMVAVALKPDRPGTLINLGSALSNMGKLEEALASCRQAIRLKSNSALAQYNLGNILSRLAQRAEAVAAFREAIRLKSDHAEVHCNLGNVLAAIGKRDESIAEYREAIRLQPGCAGAHVKLGDGLNAMGDWGEAVAAHREAVRLRPDFADAHFYLGNALAEMGKLDEAIATQGRFEDALGETARVTSSARSGAVRETRRPGLLSRMAYERPEGRPARCHPPPGMPESLQRPRHSTSWPRLGTRCSIGAIGRELSRYAEPDPVVIR